MTLRTTNFDRTFGVLAIKTVARDTLTDCGVGCAAVNPTKFAGRVFGHTNKAKQGLEAWTYTESVELKSAPASQRRLRRLYIGSPPLVAVPVLTFRLLFCGYRYLVGSSVAAIQRVERVNFIVELSRENCALNFG